MQHCFYILSKLIAVASSLNGKRRLIKFSASVLSAVAAINVLVLNLIGLLFSLNDKMNFSHLGRMLNQYYISEVLLGFSSLSFASTPILMLLFIASIDRSLDVANFWKWNACCIFMHRKDASLILTNDQTYFTFNEKELRVLSMQSLILLFYV